jgi:hypothetical protein
MPYISKSEAVTSTRGSSQGGVEQAFSTDPRRSIFRGYMYTYR